MKFKVSAKEEDETLMTEEEFERRGSPWFVSSRTTFNPLPAPRFVSRTTGFEISTKKPAPWFVSSRTTDFEFLRKNKPGS